MHLQGQRQRDCSSMRYWVWVVIAVASFYCTLLFDPEYFLMAEPSLKKSLNNNFWRNQNIKHPFVEAVVQTCFVKKVFLKVSQNSQEKTCTRVSFLVKLQASACYFC